MNDARAVGRVEGVSNLQRHVQEHPSGQWPAVYPLQLVSHTTRNQRISVVQDELVSLLKTIGVFVVRSSETSLAPGPSYAFGFSSPVSFWFQRLRL
jgi:hypothetical protein